jgi:osmotically-inducible protein OsmY
MTLRWFSAVAAVVLLTGCGQSDPGITTSVKAQFAADDLVKARNLNVDTVNHVVTLTGTVNSTAEETRALQLAKATTGVTNVVDEIQIVPGAVPTTGNVEPSGQPLTNDAGLTTAVKAALLADTGVSGLAIDVDTNNNVVTLTGSVSTQAEKSRAIDLARQTGGVSEVIDHLTVNPAKK